jgi:tripartite-type tricarboxylate transporter receptor subunit TctC
MDLPRRKFLHFNGAAALALAFRSAQAQAQAQPQAEPQAWPNRSVQLYVGDARDNCLDSVAHVLAGRLSEIWGQQVIVENALGDEPTIGFDAIAHAAPDAHTILIAAGAPQVNRFLFSKPTFYPADIAPVSLVGTFPDLIIVPNSSPLYTVENFIAMRNLVLACFGGLRPVSVHSPILPASCLNL